MLEMQGLLLKIPRGKVTTYGELARVLKSHPRAIGKMLNCNQEPEKYPCYKVVMSSGNLGGYSSGLSKKISLLTNDGLTVTNNKIWNFRKVLYRF